MSYTDYNAKPISEKIVLFEIDPLEDGDLFVNSEPGIWEYVYYIEKGNVTFNFGAGAFGYGAFGTAGVADLTNDNIRARINSFYDGSSWYTKCSSLTSVRSTDSAFFFEGSSQTLYVHFANHDPWDAFPDIKLGVSLGYANKGRYYDDIYYDARVLSVPSIGRSKDPLFFGKISFDGGTITLINADGEFDTFQADHEVYGSKARILLGFDDNEYADFKTMYEGYIENMTVSEGMFAVEVNDKRKALSRKVPISVFTTTNYPYLNEKDANKPIPLIYGSCDNVPVVCVNETEPALSAYSFVVADTADRPLTALDAVYVNGVALSALTVTLSAGTFTLSTASYATSSTVTADVRGYASAGSLIENGLEILRDILNNQFDLPYGTTYYDTTGWGSAETGAANLAVFINEPTEGWKVIEDISYSLHGNFIVQDDGKFTFRTYDSARPLDQTIHYWEILNQDLEVGYETDEVLTSCRVLYDKNWEEGTYTEFLHNTDEEDIADTFKLYRERSFETFLTAPGSAESFADSIMALSDDVRSIFRVRTKMQSIDRELSDFVRVEYKPKNRDFIGWCTAEVVGKTVNLDNMIIDLTLRKT